MNTEICWQWKGRMFLKVSYKFWWVQSCLFKSQIWEFRGINSDEKLTTCLLCVQHLYVWTQKHVNTRMHFWTGGVPDRGLVLRRVQQFGEGREFQLWLSWCPAVSTPWNAMRRGSSRLCTNQNGIPLDQQRACFYLPLRHAGGAMFTCIIGCSEITRRMWASTVLASAIIKHQGQTGIHRAAVTGLKLHMALRLQSGNSVTWNP